MPPVTVESATVKWRKRTVQMLEAVNFKILESLADLPDADNVRCDTAANLIYVGYGEGALAVHPGNER